MSCYFGEVSANRSPIRIHLSSQLLFFSFLFLVPLQPPSFPTALLFFVEQLVDFCAKTRKQDANVCITLKRKVERFAERLQTQIRTKQRKERDWSVGAGGSILAPAITIALTSMFQTPTPFSFLQYQHTTSNRRTNNVPPPPSLIAQTPGFSEYIHSLCCIVKIRRASINNFKKD